MHLRARRIDLTPDKVTDEIYWPHLCDVIVERHHLELRHRLKQDAGGHTPGRCESVRIEVIRSLNCQHGRYASTALYICDRHLRGDPMCSSLGTWCIMGPQYESGPTRSDVNGDPAMPRL
ncbi:hypothetical protein LSAT2_027845 [Lamellibrachia satsuma]|nr:hypothetical protein LSAT2_027845 [Lamellibrachia satsuma]